MIRRTQSSNLYPSIVKNDLQDIEVHIWNHNKERMFDRACTIIDKETDKMVVLVWLDNWRMPKSMPITLLVI